MPLYSQSIFSKVFLGITLLYLVGCSRNTTIVGPKEYYLNPTVESESSTINVIGEVSTAQTELLINTKLPDILYEDNNIEDDNYTVKVSKRTSFLLEPQGDFIFITAPLKIDAKARMNVGFFKAEQGGSFDLDVRFKLQPRISKNWEINSFSKIDSYQWINEPKLKLGPIEVSVAPYLEKMIAAQEYLITQKIDDMVKKSVDIKSFAEKAWAYTQKPIPINTSINAWAKIDPKDIYFIPIKGSNESMKFGIGMKANVETTFGNKPYVQTKMLPAISLGNANDSLFAINLLSKIGYKEAASFAKDKLMNTTYSFSNDKYKIKLEDLSFYGSGDNLVAKALLSGDYNGVLYLFGTPTFDSTTSTIKIKNLDFTAESIKGLKKTYSWIFKGNITRKLSEKLEFSINNKADQAAETLANYLNNINLSDKIKIDAKVFHLKPNKIIVAENQLIISIQAKGKINLKMDINDLK